MLVVNSCTFQAKRKRKFRVPRVTGWLTFFHYAACVDQNKVPLAMIQTMRKLKSGYINGTRVMLGNLGDFLNTSAITDLSFLGSTEEGYPDSEFVR